MIRNSYQFTGKPQIAPRVPVKGRPKRLLDLGWQPASMRAQIARHQRQHSVMFCETEKFAPVERGSVPVRNAGHAVRNWFDASARTQEVKFPGGTARLT